MSKRHKGTRITSLQINNVMRVSAVQINPDGNTVIIGGNNAQGKSTTLNSIMMAIAGEKYIPAKPLKDGEKKGMIEIKLDNGMTITRRFTEKGTSLKLEDKEGNKLTSQQAILNKLLSTLAFDPLKFMHMAPKDQATTLRGLVGIDFTELDNKYSQIYSDRTLVNREVKNLRAVYNSADGYEGVPKEEQSVSELLKKHNEMTEVNKSKINARTEMISQTEAKDSVSKQIELLENKLEELRLIEQQHEEALTEMKAAYMEMPFFKAEEIALITEQMEQAEETNRRVRANQQLEKTFTELRDKECTANELTKELEDIDAEKQKALEEAAFPIDGLSFNEDGVFYNSIPIDQASSAEQLRISTSIGIAMNSELRVMLVRDGSLLDEDNLVMMNDLADDNDMQIWIEKVGSGDECSVIIEDGMVKE